MTTRSILRLTGGDVLDFLQGLITNDISKLNQGLVYAALLTPQGKYLADFFLKSDGDDVLLDVDATLADGLIKRLNMYKLRADVTIAKSDLNVQRGAGSDAGSDCRPATALPDPRHPDMGWRAYSRAAESDDGSDWTAKRVAHCIPQTGIELTPDSYILEVGFEALNGVDFRKGCYVGQEVTARMKHKTELRKGLAVISLSGTPQAGADITVNQKPVGKVLSIAGNRAIAYLRFDRATGDMQIGDVIARRVSVD
jgi:folate-binding protein YgfZ